MFDIKDGNVRVQGMLRRNIMIGQGVCNRQIQGKKFINFSIVADPSPGIRITGTGFLEFS